MHLWQDSFKQETTSYILVVFLKKKSISVLTMKLPKRLIYFRLAVWTIIISICHFFKLSVIT